MPGKCAFQDAWLINEKHKEWVLREPSKFSAKCSLCCTSINISSMGEAALRSHLKADRHEKAAKRARSDRRSGVNGFFSVTSSKTSGAAAQAESGTISDVAITSTTSAGPSSLQRACIDNERLKAEILWTLKMTEAHYSNRSSECTQELFSVMFPDSAIARNFKCGETKSRYLITFGLAPHFSQLVCEKARTASTGFVLLFDESLNKKNKLKQMDFHVRFWDGDTVKTRYLTSEFLGHACGVDLLGKIKTAMVDAGLQQSKLLQLSMDGPAVNWKVYNDLQKGLKDVNAGLLHVGSCGLHTIHNAFSKGSRATNWHLDSFLSSAYYLFKDCPARRDDFVTVTGSQAFPPKFCNHRWLENASVAKANIDLLPALEKFCAAADKKTITVPTNKSYATVKEGVLHCPLLACRLSFFVSVAREMEPFLTKYQADNPMLPFMSTDLEAMMRSLMRRFLKATVVSDATHVQQLMAIKFDQSTYCSLAETELGSLTQTRLQKIEKKASLSHAAVKEFRMDCRKFLEDTVKHLLNKNPLKYPLVKAIRCLDPRTMRDKNTCRDGVKIVLQCLVEANKITHEISDDALKEFQVLLDTAAYTSYDSSTRLDTWYHGVIGGQHSYHHLWTCVQMLLTLSHGQASVERGFSYNKEVITDNLSKAALKARRVVLDHIKTAGGLLQVKLTKQLLVSAGSANRRYNSYLEEQRQLKLTEGQVQRKRKKQDELEGIKKKLKLAETDSRHLLQEADELCFKAGQQRALILLDRSNSLRLSAKGRTDEAAELKKQLEKVQDELKTMV